MNNKIKLLLMALIFSVQEAYCLDSVTSNIRGALKSAHETNYFTVAIALLFVVCLIYITGILYAKLNVLGMKTLKNQIKDVDDTKVVVCSTTSIGQNKSLHVIELAGKKMLIASTNTNISLIKDLDPIVNEPKTVAEKVIEKVYPSASVQDVTLQTEEFSIDKEKLADVDVESEEISGEEYGLYKKYLS